MSVLQNGSSCVRGSDQVRIMRRTFGKRLNNHQIIRAKLGEMASKVQTCEHGTCCISISNGIPDSEMGPQCALLKVQMEYFLNIVLESKSIFGGSSIVREDKVVWSSCIVKFEQRYGRF